MNEDQSKIIMDHMGESLPEITKSLFKKLNLNIDKTSRPFTFRHFYQALNCHLLAETIKFLSSKI